MPFLLLVLPFLNFVKSNGYSLVSPEVLLASAPFLVTGAVLGIASQVHRFVRALVIAGAATLLIDVQTRLFDTYSLHQYVWLPLGLFGLLLVIKARIEPFLAMVAAVMLAMVFVAPAQEPLVRAGQGGGSVAPTEASAAADSIWIHVIADEHIGVESIPRDFDPGGRLASRIRRDYLENGFTLFGRAFTPFPQTHLSLPNIFNFSEVHPVAHVVDDASQSGVSLKNSEYLGRLQALGFELNVYDTDYFRICSPAFADPRANCNRYRGNTIWGLDGTSLSTLDKSVLILRSYARLSKIYDRAIRALSLDERLSLPETLAPLVGLKAFDRFRADVLNAQPGSAWLLHFILPHHPYVLDRECSIREPPWTDLGRDSGGYVRNTDEARRAKYPLYLDQVECVHQQLQDLFASLRDAGIYDKAHIVVHGDHGSRIAPHNLRERSRYDPEFIPSAWTLVDYYGTLFAYKAPGQTTGEYRREIVSVASLLDGASGGRLADSVQELRPTVYLVEWDDDCVVDLVGSLGCRLLSHTMPQFSEGTLERTAVEASIPGIPAIR